MQNKPHSISNKKYIKPQLICYGKLAEITQGGSGMASENSNGKASKRP